MAKSDLSPERIAEFIEKQRQVARNDEIVRTCGDCKGRIGITCSFGHDPFGCPTGPQAPSEDVTSSVQDQMENGIDCVPTRKKERKENRYAYKKDRLPGTRLNDIDGWKVVKIVGGTVKKIL